MTRIELYRLVWEKPRSRLAPELGLSDVGLTKICARYAIPTPPRGHWAKLAAGGRVEQVPLPQPDDDRPVRLPSPQLVKRSRQAKSISLQTRLATRSTPTSASIVLMPSSLAGCHDLVKNTRVFFDRVRRAEREVEAGRRAHRPGEPAWHTMNSFLMQRRSFSRYICSQAGALRVTATLENVPWILRFHHGLLRGLQANDVQVVPCEEDGSHWVEVRHDRGSVRLNFSEQVEKNLRTAARGSPTYRPTGRFTLKAERDQSGTRIKTWSGTAAELEHLLPTIVAELSVLPAAETVRHMLRIKAAEEEKRQRDEERRQRAETAARLAEDQRRFAAVAAAEAARRDAHAEQIQRARRVATSALEFDHITGLLARLAASEGARDCPGVQTWISMVREQIKDPVDELLRDLQQEVTGEDPPLWWPPAIAWPTPGTAGDEASTGAR